jgi:hypothetical protein
MCCEIELEIHHNVDVLAFFGFVVVSWLPNHSDVLVGLPRGFQIPPYTHEELINSFSAGFIQGARNIII